MCPYCRGHRQLRSPLTLVALCFGSLTLVESCVRCHGRDSLRIQWHSAAPHGSLGAWTRVAGRQLHSDPYGPGYLQAVGVKLPGCPRYQTERVWFVNAVHLRKSPNHQNHLAALHTSHNPVLALKAFKPVSEHFRTAFPHSKDVRPGLYSFLGPSARSSIVFSANANLENPIFSYRDFCSWRFERARMKLEGCPGQRAAEVTSLAPSETLPVHTSNSKP